MYYNNIIDEGILSFGLISPHRVKLRKTSFAIFNANCIELNIKAITIYFVIPCNKAIGILRCSLAAIYFDVKTNLTAFYIRTLIL